MNDAIFIAKKATGRLAIGDKKEIDRAVFRRFLAPIGNQVIADLGRH